MDVSHVRAPNRADVQTGPQLGKDWVNDVYGTRELIALETVDLPGPGYIALTKGEKLLLNTYSNKVIKHYDGHLVMEVRGSVPRYHESATSSDKYCISCGFVRRESVGARHLQNLQ